MDSSQMFTVENVLLTRRGHHIKGTLILSKFHMVFTFQAERAREIWLCYPIIEKISKARGCSWQEQAGHSVGDSRIISPQSPAIEHFDKYSASHIRILCKDFTYYSFDFANDSICTEVYQSLSKLVISPKVKGTITDFYAFDYKPNALESKLPATGWSLYDPKKEYQRQKLLTDDNGAWRLTSINANYRFCPSYPSTFVVPASISDSVLQHAGKFRSKQRVPAIVYKHRLSGNGNLIARCSQPLVGLNFQNRSLQDEKLVEDIFKSQELERGETLSESSELRDQPQRNLIVDLRPLTNAMAQHALGAGTENVDNYRGKGSADENGTNHQRTFQQVDKIFCNIDNIHVMRDSLNKLTAILSDLDKHPITEADGAVALASLQQSLTKTQWLHRISIILQAVDRITKSVHLNNTNVLIHCSDGWDRTSQASALAQLCLDPYFRTMEGFMVLVEKEWLSFGFKFSTRSDHGGCIGAILPNAPLEQKQESALTDSETAANIPLSASEASLLSENGSYSNHFNGGAKAVTSFLQRAASHIKSTAQAAKSSASQDGDLSSRYNLYSGSNEKSPIFHQFLDCVYQIYRQQPAKFEFNSRFLKRLLYHAYSCQYGTFLCDTEGNSKCEEQLPQNTVSVWDYFLSRPAEFLNPLYDESSNNEALFYNYSEVKWWYELYGRSDEEMNGLSNSLDKKFAQLKLNAPQNVAIKAGEPASSHTP